MKSPSKKKKRERMPRVTIIFPLYFPKKERKKKCLKLNLKERKR